MFNLLAKLLKYQRDTKAIVGGPEKYGKRVARRRTTQQAGQKITQWIKSL